MATYAIGDIQGCFASLQTLLQHIHFDPLTDRLWFTGDLVNRGPQSLAVLRFIKQLGPTHSLVLGNHDLTLLAIAYGVRERHARDTFEDILTAPDRDELLQWLQQQPLLHYDASLQTVMTHAGIAPCWTLEEAIRYAKEVEHILKSDQASNYLHAMYGNQPDLWHEQLSGMDRLRCITNYFTRMRFCTAEGRLNLTYKGTIAEKPADLYPWFDLPHRQPISEKILFGHWAALNGKTNQARIFALDTGCVWGNCLTALRLEDEQLFRVAC